jgi:hypothetical protein
MGSFRTSVYLSFFGDLSSHLVDGLQQLLYILEANGVVAISRHRFFLSFPFPSEPGQFYGQAARATHAVPIEAVVHKRCRRAPMYCGPALGLCMIRHARHCT